MTADLSLSAEEARVLGVLIEKSMTTPDQYPLSLNALVNGCNQKSNRDPVLDLEAREVKRAARELGAKQLSVEIWPSTGSRIEKYRHLADSGLGVEERHVAVLGELLLRRAQMPGELRTRVSRMTRIDSQGELKQILAELIDKGLVTRLDPAPGSRAERYDHLLCGAPAQESEAAAPAAPAPVAAQDAPETGLSLEALHERIQALERRVAELERGDAPPHS